MEPALLGAVGGPEADLPALAMGFLYVHYTTLHFPWARPLYACVIHQAKMNIFRVKEHALPFCLFSNRWIARDGAWHGMSNERVCIFFTLSVCLSVIPLFLLSCLCGVLWGCVAICNDLFEYTGGGSGSMWVDVGQGGWKRNELLSNMSDVSVQCGVRGYMY